MIKQKGKGNQLSLGDNSPNTISKNNKLNFTKENRKWFFSGLILPIISGLIVEIFKSGSLSNIFSYFINIF